MTLSQPLASHLTLRAQRRQGLPDRLRARLQQVVPQLTFPLLVQGTDRLGFLLRVEPRQLLPLAHLVARFDEQSLDRSGDVGHDADAIFGADHRGTRRILADAANEQERERSDDQQAQHPVGARDPRRRDAHDIALVRARIVRVERLTPKRGVCLADQLLDLPAQCQLAERRAGVVSEGGERRAFTLGEHVAGWSARDDQHGVTRPVGTHHRLAQHALPRAQVGGIDDPAKAWMLGRVRDGQLEPAARAQRDQAAIGHELRAVRVGAVEQDARVGIVEPAPGAISRGDRQLCSHQRAGRNLGIDEHGDVAHHVEHVARHACVVQVSRWGQRRLQVTCGRQHRLHERDQACVG